MFEKMPFEWMKAEAVLPPGACANCGGEGQVHATCAPAPDNPDGVTGETCAPCEGSGLARSPIREQVIAFHKKFVPDQGIGEGPPCVPGDDMVRFRLKIVFEEAFELLEACLKVDEGIGRYHFNDLKKEFGLLLKRAGLQVNIVKAMDALGDLDSVSEGTRLAFHVDGRPIADAIFQSNLSKTAPSASAGGASKAIKGEGYYPPDIEGELKK